MKRIGRCLVLASFLLSAANAHAGTFDPDRFILAKRGSIPIILTAPHGGQDVLPRIKTRTKGHTLTDAGTFELTEELAKRLTKLVGGEPYIVSAKFHRKYVDANRAENDAFEDPNAKPVYFAFHNCIKDFVAEVKQKYPNAALLLDIHGQSDDKDVIHRGTRDGKTVSHLIQRHGLAALIGQKSLLGNLQSKGYEVFPPNTPLGNPPEDQRFKGGYIVATYGSNNSNGIDAIQLEIGRSIRARPTFVDDLAEVIAVFWKTYLIP